MPNDYQALLAEKYFMIFMHMAAGSVDWYIAEQLNMSENVVEQIQKENLSAKMLKKLWSRFCESAQAYRDAISSEKRPWDEEDQI